jgi:hypothetical protein
MRIVILKGPTFWKVFILKVAVCVLGELVSFTLPEMYNAQ